MLSGPCCQSFASGVLFTCISPFCTKETRHRCLCKILQRKLPKTFNLLSSLFLFFFLSLSVSLSLHPESLGPHVTPLLKNPHGSPLPTELNPNFCADSKCLLGPAPHIPFQKQLLLLQALWLLAAPPFPEHSRDCLLSSGCSAPGMPPWA